MHYLNATILSQSSAVHVASTGHLDLADLQAGVLGNLCVTRMPCEMQLERRS